jgi:hypothetical protein
MTTLSRQQIEEIARGLPDDDTSDGFPRKAVAVLVSDLRGICALALQALDAGQPVAWQWSRQTERGTEWVVVHDKAMAEACQQLFGNKGTGQKVQALYASPSVPADKGEPTDADTIAQLVKERDALREALDECEAALKLTECPHPARGRPADDMAESCLDSGNCGCCYGTAFMDIRRARTQQHGAKE